MQEQDKNILYIFNGDCAYQAWQKVTGGSAEALVWREVYLEGPLPADCPLEDFELARAEYLHTLVPEHPVENLHRYLLDLDRRLLSLTAQDTLLLYFDCCMYDMVMLARIMFLLKNTPATVHLFCEDAVLGNETELYTRPVTAFPRVSGEEIAIFADAWQAILHGPEAVAEFNRSAAALQIPFLAEAMIRYGEDHPADGSMGKSHRRLLHLVCRENLHTFPEIFRAFNAGEKYPFLGDTSCKLLLNTLVTQGHIVNTGTADMPYYAAPPNR